MKDQQEDIIRLEASIKDEKRNWDILTEKMTEGYTVSQGDRDKMDALKIELKDIALYEKMNQEMKLREKIYNDREEERRTISKLGRGIDKIDEDKREILRKVKFPIEGMQFGEIDVLMGGIPFTNCSTAEQIKMAIAINAEIDNSARIMILKDGNALDDNSLKDIEKIAKEKKIQIFIEEVQKSDDQNLIVVDDGTVND